MKKRLIIFLICILMIFSATACGQTTETVQTETPETESQMLYIYSLDEEIGKCMESVYELHPEWKDKTEIVVISPENYDSTIESLISEKSDKYPDLFVADADSLAKFVNSKNTLGMSELGINQDAYSQMYPYTVNSVKDEKDEVRAMCYKITPGAFIYRRSLAEQYLGSDSYKDVQAYVKDWETFVDTAHAISQKSGGSVKMLAGSSDINKVFSAGRTENWIAGDQVTVGSEMEKLFDVRLGLDKNKYTLGKAEGTPDFLKAAAKDTVFGYFVTPDFIFNELSENCGGKVAGTGTFGDWGVCQGPMAFDCGGSWIFAGKRCHDTGLAAEILKSLCADMDSMTKIYGSTGLFVNNIKVISDAFYNGARLDILGGNDYLDKFNSQALDIEKIYAGEYDKEIDQLFFQYADSYASGKTKKEDAINAFIEDANKVIHGEIQAAEEAEQPAETEGAE